MPTKIGGGGKQQAYGYNGRYCKSNSQTFAQVKLSKREKTRKKRANIINSFCEQADKKGDYLVKETFLEIEKAIPNSVQLVNQNKYDDIHLKTREFDIMTKKVIIEVKSGKARKCLTQLQEQNKFANSKGKKYVVYAPNILDGAKRDYIRNGIVIKTKISDLINFIKENEK